MSKINVLTEDGVSVIEVHDPPANTYSYDMMQEIFVSFVVFVKRP